MYLCFHLREGDAEKKLKSRLRSCYVGERGSSREGERQSSFIFTREFLDRTKVCDGGYLPKLCWEQEERSKQRICTGKVHHVCSSNIRHKQLQTSLSLKRHDYVLSNSAFPSTGTQPEYNVYLCGEPPLDALTEECVILKRFYVLCTVSLIGSQCPRYSFKQLVIIRHYSEHSNK